METKLWHLSQTAKGRILSIDENCPSSACLRLSELGLIPGQEVVCLKRSPFKGPRLYQISGSVFSLAQDIANKVLIEEV